jgi:hypothetical protein
VFVPAQAQADRQGGEEAGEQEQQTAEQVRRFPDTSPSEYRTHGRRCQIGRREQIYSGVPDWKR